MVHPFVKDTAVLQVGNILSTGIGVLTAIIIARWLQSEKYSLHSLVFVFTGLLNILNIRKKIICKQLKTRGDYLRYNISILFLFSMFDFIKFFQKIKWSILARINPDYYINSKLVEKDKNKYKESGRDDVCKFILQDDLLKSMIDFREATVLEIGCGNGRMTEFLAGIFKNVYAIDISSRMVELAESRLVYLKNINFFVSDGLRCAVPDNTVDLVFSYIVFQHFPSMGMILENMKEVKRILKDGGLAKIQFRGRLAHGGIFRFFKWYYGVYLTKEKVSDLAHKLDLQILSISGEETKEMWVIFKK